MKKLQNNVEKSHPNGSTKKLTVGGLFIFWDHLKEAYEWDQRHNSCPIHEKLTEDHFHLNPSSKMRNKLAEDVLDRKMLILVKVYYKILQSCYSYLKRYALGLVTSC